MRDQFLKWITDFDTELAEESIRLFKEGKSGLSKVEINIMGQLGLLLGLDDVGLNSTADLDATIRGDQVVKSLFKRFLLRHHLVFDEDGELIQMPAGTQWMSFYDGKLIKIFVADPLSIIKSKAQFQRLKDKAQLNKIFDRHPEWKQKTIAAGISLEWLNA